VDDEEYCWERPISSQQAGFVMVSQCRDWLPDVLGGLYWYTPDDCYTTCFAPFYAGIKRAPRSFAQGDIDRFSWDSAWWVYNFVSNRTYNCYSRIMPDVAEAQKEMEDAIFAMQPAVEETALKLFKQDPELAKKYLTTYCVSTAEGLVERWKELGYVRTPEKGTEGVEYPEAWLRRILEEKPDQFKLPKWKKEHVE
jgi:dipeptidase